MNTQDQHEQQPAGWYPDPEQVATQRFWDGQAWTDQRAPLPASTPTATSALNVRLLTTIVGAIAAALGVFLPRVDSPTSLHIADNSVMATDVIVGALVLFVAFSAVVGVIQDRFADTTHPWLVIVGLVIIGAAVYYGTGDRLELVTTSPTGSFFGGERFDGSPGVGLYIMGAGGALIALAGFLPTQQRRRS
jgi:hypothetical protein